MNNVSHHPAEDTLCVVIDCIGAHLDWNHEGYHQLVNTLPPDVRKRVLMAHLNTFYFQGERNYNTKEQTEIK